MDMDTLGYFIYMDEMEKQQKQQQEDSDDSGDDESNWAALRGRAHSRCTIFESVDSTPAAPFTKAPEDFPIKKVLWKSFGAFPCNRAKQ